MKLFFRRAFFFAFVMVFGFSSSFGSGRSHYTLIWQEPVIFPVNEDGYVEVIYFEDAVYDESKPEVPMFSLRKQLQVPFFSYKPLFHKKVPWIAQRRQALDICRIPNYI